MLAPQTHAQPSRKGKRAWRKNVDITAVTQGIDAAREEAVLTGGPVLADVPADTLFQTDVAGSETLKTRVRKEFPGLKADEIIAARSKVPAVDTHKRKGITNGVLAEDERSKKRKISGKELSRLKGIARGSTGGHNDVVELRDVATHDPWADDRSPGPDSRFSYLDPPKLARLPSTLEQAPIAVTANGKKVPHVRRPINGRSYNPLFEDWANLLETEGRKEVEKEEQRIAQAKLELLRLDRVAKAADEADRADREAEEREILSEYETEWDGIQSEMDDDQLSTKRPTRKTPAERNKIKRRKLLESLAKHERRMKEKDVQLKQIQALVKTDGSSAVEFAGWSDDGSEDESDTEGDLRRRKFGKIDVPAVPLELVLPEELQDSLRKLKPEGNLLKDRFRNMIVQGRVEARKPLSMQKKANTKATEKWSYKDWKLPVKTS